MTEAHGTRSVAVFVPCYKRPEYTEICIKALEEAQHYIDVRFFLYDDGSNDETPKILSRAKLVKELILNKNNVGLRNNLLDFFERTHKYTYLAKVDNDCRVPKYWLRDLLSQLIDNDLDILSPNVNPSNAALKYGREIGKDYLPTDIIGGVWVMKRSMVEDLYLERLNTSGITGAVQIMNAIRLDKEPNMAWSKTVVFEDIGHWSGEHPEHIKSRDHEIYSAEVRRRIAWRSSE